MDKLDNLEIVYPDKLAHCLSNLFRTISDQLEFELRPYVFEKTLLIMTLFEKVMHRVISPDACVVLTMRYGLKDSKARTHADVVDGVVFRNREQVRRLENEAIFELRRLKIHEPLLEELRSQRVRPSRSPLIVLASVLYSGFDKDPQRSLLFELKKRPEDSVLQDLMKKMLLEQQFTLLQLLYGLSDGIPLSHDEVDQKLNIHFNRYDEDKILDKLRETDFCYRCLFTVYPQSKVKVPIKVLGLGTAITNVLTKNNGITTLDQLKELTYLQFTGLTKVGPTTAEKILQALARFGIFLKGAPEKTQ